MRTTRCGSASSAYDVCAVGGDLLHVDETAPVTAVKIPIQLRLKALHLAIALRHAA